MPANKHEAKKESKNESISASEINRYLFCNYQWYYQRTYGTAELNRRKRAYLEEIGVTPETSDESPMARGRRYHADFARRQNKSPWRALRRIAVLLAIGLLLYLIYTLFWTGEVVWPWMLW